MLWWLRFGVVVVGVGCCGDGWNLGVVVMVMKSGDVLVEWLWGDYGFCEVEWVDCLEGGGF